jgi:hypothetical protein
VEKQNLPPFIPFLASALILAAMGLAGLFLLFNLTLPTLAPRWLFFFLTTITASGLSLPVIYFLHWRFPSPTPVTAGIIVRQAIWVGLYFDLLAWFQMGRFLTLPLGFALAAGLGAIEFAIRLAERSRFVAGENE